MFFSNVEESYLPKRLQLFKLDSISLGGSIKAEKGRRSGQNRQLLKGGKEVVARGEKGIENAV